MNDKALTQTARRDLAAELEADDGSFPESWRPSPGDQVIGRLVRWSKGKTAYGKKWIAILETEDAAGGQPSSLVSVWLLHKVLKEEMEKLEPKIGERIGIRRLEDGKNGNGKCYRYKVIVDRKPEAELQPDWNTLAEGGLPENAEPRTADPGAASAEDESDIPW